jgi:hypothetical protein
MRYRKPFEQPEQPSMGESNGRQWELLQKLVVTYFKAEK